MEKFASTITAIVLILGLTLGFWYFWNGKSLTPAPSFGNSYVEVVLQNGETYFGKIKKFNSPYPVLTETAYIVLVQKPPVEGEVPEGATTAPLEPDRKLVKRGGEPQQPSDEMVLNAEQIVRISKLRPESQIVQIMENWKAGR